MSHLISVAVVIPLYKYPLSASEAIALSQCLNVLSTHDIILLCPNRLKSNNFISQYQVKDVIFIDDKWMSSIDNYNKLMLSRFFYGLFIKYNYILIHQLDAFVFSDRLLEFIKLGYDYIGAPWIGGCQLKRYSYRGARAVNRLFPFLNRDYLLYVGNGGFSLRRTAAFLSIIKKARFNLLTWTQNEDTFWSYYGQKYSHFKIPSLEIAMDFAIELDIDLSTVKKLPFGCHAWDKYNYEFVEDYYLQHDRKIT